MGFQSGNYYTPDAVEQKSNVKLDGITLEQFDGVVKKLSTSNAERVADAIRIADGHSFLAANPWFKNTKSNRNRVDRWLHSKGITDSTYPDVIDATEELAKAGLLDVDEAAFAQHLDGKGPKTFKGALTGRTFDSLDSLIAQERQAAIKQQGAEKPSDFEQAFNALPIEEQQQMLRNAQKQSQALADGVISQENADSWLTFHAEYRDDTFNGKIMREQLFMNGVINRPATIEDYEIANQQLVSAGLLRQNPAALRKQEAAEVVARAQHAVKHSAAFDTTTIEEMEQLPLDEVRRRAQGNYTGRD